MDACLDAALRGGVPLLPHARASFREAASALRAEGTALAAEAASASPSAAAAGAERLSKSVAGVCAAVSACVDAHRPTFAQLRAAESLRAGGLSRAEGSPRALRLHEQPEGVLRLSVLFDQLQYNAIGLRVQSSSLLARTRGAPPPIGSIRLPHLVRGVLEDVSAFCVEKFGVRPPVHVEVAGEAVAGGSTVSAGEDELGGRTPAGLADSSSLLGVPEHAAFCISELLKNAFRAHIDAFTAGGVDDAPPVRIRIVTCDAHIASVRVSDCGGGLAQAGAMTEFAYFGSTFVPMDAGWTYSREHGAPFTGMGLGLVRARLHARYMGGGVALMSQPGGGCDACVWFERAGRNVGDWQAAVLT